MMHNRIKYLSGFLMVLFFVACKKPPTEQPNLPEQYENGIVLLNEGLFEQNNASLSFYSYAQSQVFQLVFKNENGRGLGDTANDFEAYTLNGNDYIIIVVDVSSQVEIIERYSLKTVAQIPLFDGENAREPRRVKVNGDRAYVCNFDGTVAVINLNNYTVESLLEVGANPDGLAIVEDRLYVSNSGGLHFPVYDSTVSVINMNTNSVEETFKTRINAASMVVDSEGDIYLVSRGNHTDIPPALVRINTTTNEVEEVLDIPVGSIALLNDWLYWYHQDEEAVYRYNVLTETPEGSPFINASDYDNFYGIHIDAEESQIYCVDANGYVNSATVMAYNLSGTFLFEFTAGLNTNSLIFNN